MLFISFLLPLVFWQYHRASLPNWCVVSPTVLHRGCTGCSGCCPPSPPDAAPRYLPGPYPLLTLSHLAETEADVAYEEGLLVKKVCLHIVLANSEVDKNFKSLSFRWGEGASVTGPVT